MAAATGGSDKKSPQSTQNALSGFLSYFYGNFVVLLLGFIQTPIVTRIMSADEYGRTGMFETAVSVIYIFAILGMDQSYIRYYYKKDIDRVALLKQCLIPSVVIVSVLLTVYAIFADYANFYLFERTGTDITVLVIAYTIISVFERFFFLDVRMQQNGKLYSNINIAEKVLSILTILGAWYFLRNDFRVSLYAMAVPWGCTTAFIMIRFAFVHRGYKRSKAVSGQIRVPQKELISYGLPFIMVLLMEWLLSSCDKLALKTWSTYDELGVYNSAMKIIVLLLTFKNTFIAYWSPVAMERFENGKMEDNKVFFRNAYEVTQFLCVCAAAGLILFRKVVVLLLGSDYRGAESIIPFLTLMPVFAVMFEITNQSIKYSKHNMYLNLASAVAIICNVAGNALLVPRYAGTGAALTTGISYIAYFAMGSVLSEKCLKIGYAFKKTAIYAVMLLMYCAEASFVNNALLDTAAGIVLLAAACLIDRKALGSVVKYAIEKIRH